MLFLVEKRFSWEKKKNVNLLAVKFFETDVCEMFSPYIYIHTCIYVYVFVVFIIQLLMQINRAS